MPVASPPSKLLRNSPTTHHTIRREPPSNSPGITLDDMFYLIAIFKRVCSFLDPNEAICTHKIFISELKVDLFAVNTIMLLASFSFIYLLTFCFNSNEVIVGHLNVIATCVCYFQHSRILRRDA